MEEIAETQNFMARSPKEISISQERLSPCFDKAWENRKVLDSEPILIPQVVSGNGLPVRMGIRETNDGKSLTVGLFEDKTSRDPNAQMSLTKIGQLVMYINAEGIPVVSTSSHALDPLGESGKTLSQDKYFQQLTTQFNIKAIAVGLDNLDSDVHRRKGLGTILVDIGALTTRRLGKNRMEYPYCNNDSISLLQRSGYEINIVSRPVVESSAESDQRANITLSL